MTFWLPSELGAMAPLADLLLRASVAGAAFIGGVWLLCRLAPRLPSRVRATLWWLACLKLLVGCVWLAPIELPLLPAPALEAAPWAPAPSAARVGAQALRSASDEPMPRPVGTAGTAAERSGPSRTGLLVLSLVLAWGLGVAAGAASTTVEGVRLARTVRTARPVTEGPAAALLELLGRRLGLARLPALRTTPRAASPQAVGLLRPTILLPPAALAAPREELTMVLCHELVHLRRRDPWLAWVPLLARRLFFFHPLASLAQREFVLAREAACDAEVLRLLGTAPRAYGRLLLRWGVAPRETGLAAAGASPSVQDLKRRLQMLDTTDSTRRSSPWWWLAAATLVLGLVPVTIVAQAPPAPPAEAPSAPPPAAVAAPAPAPARAPASVADLEPALPESPAPATAPRAASPGPPAVTAPPAPPAPPAHSSSGSTWTWSDDGEAYAVLSEGSHMILHGDSDDAAHIRSLRTGDEPLLWFRHDGAEYVVHDHETIERARRIAAPQVELGKQQGELGHQQGGLGAKQGELGAEQGRLGAQQAKLAARQAELAMAAAGNDESAQSARTDTRQLSDRMRELGERQRELGQRQRELGERQRELGEKQRALGEQQRAAAERARREMAELIDRALSAGFAERVE